MTTEFNESVIAEFRAGAGQVGGDLAGTPVLLIRHYGARSGTERVTPLAYSAQTGGRLVVAASNGGSPAHPAWYHNLKAHPAVVVELGPDTFSALAAEVTGAAHRELWARLAEETPVLARYQAKTARTIPLFTLTRH